MAFGETMVRWPERPGLRCLALSTLVGLGPLAAFLAMRRHDFVHAGLNGAAMGVAAGACAWVAVDLWCPVAYVPHLLLGHVLPLVLLGGIGALIGRSRATLLRHANRHRRRACWPLSRCSEPAAGPGR